MNLYQFSRQYGKAHWEKMDYDELPGSKITNMEEYGQVCDRFSSASMILTRPDSKNRPHYTIFDDCQF